MPTRWWITGGICLAMLVVVSVSVETGGYFSLVSARGCGTTDLEIAVDQPIPTGLRVRYVKVLAREKDYIIANPQHAEFPHEWKELSDEGVADSVFFAFSTEPQLFGYRQRRSHYADMLLVWFQKDGRETFREIPLPGNSVRGPWKVVVPVVEP